MKGLIKLLIDESYLPLSNEKTKRAASQLLVMLEAEENKKKPIESLYKEALDNKKMLEATYWRNELLEVTSLISHKPRLKEILS